MIEQEVDIYTYSINLLTLTLKIKFPCKVYLEYAGHPITSEVSPSAPNKFTFNQEATLQNQTDKEYIEVLVQLVTDKGAKYVGGVLKFMESELIGSEGERIVVNMQKCLDTEAFCEARVDQVSTSKVTKKVHNKRKPLLKSEYNGDILGVSRPIAPHKQGQTKSEFNFPLSISRSKDPFQFKRRDHTLVGTQMRKGHVPRFGEGEAIGGGMSALQFEVYKEGYNKLKQKYRRQAENARNQLNKRMALESSENNLKLELMRCKMKLEELDKTVHQKNSKIKEYTENISVYQKKQLDTKYLKEEVQNKNHTIRHLEQTNRTLLKDNNDLKSLQTTRTHNEQSQMRALKEDLQKARRDAENKQSEWQRQLKVKNQTISRMDYDLHVKTDEIERLKCDISDLEKTISSKSYQWERLQQTDRSSFQAKQDTLRDQMGKLQRDKSDLQGRIRDLEGQLQGKRGEIVRMDYDKKVLSQTNDSIQRENEELRGIRDRYVELVRDHKLMAEEKSIVEKNREREGRQKDGQLQDMTQRLTLLSENSKRSIRELEDKNKTIQVRLMQAESQNELLRSQVEKSKRQNELLSKEMGEMKTHLKEMKNQNKEKEEKLLTLTSQIADIKSRSKQGDYSTRLQTQRTRQQLDKVTKLYQQERNRVNELSDGLNKAEVQGNKLKMEWQFRQEKVQKELGYAKEKINSLQTFKADLEFQITAAAQTNTNLKNIERAQTDKIQKVEMEILQTREQVEKQKKEARLLEEKLANSENALKAKGKEINEGGQARETLEKQISKLQADLGELRNELNREKNDKQRHQKMVEILQGDLGKARDQHKRLNEVISSRQRSEQQVREELKKQREQHTKLDMKLAALRKEYEKFRQNVSQNIHSVFASIPEGLEIPSQRSRIQVRSHESFENSEILSMLTTYGRQVRNNMARLSDQLKVVQRDHQKLNSDFSSTVNKNNTSQFEYNQAISRLEEQINDLIQSRQKQQNKYEQEVFLLEGRIREKQAVINQQQQQLEQLDFTCKNARIEYQGYQEESAKKDYNRTRLINELKEQIEYHITTISLLQNNVDKLQEQLQILQIEAEEKGFQISKLEKELHDMTQRQFQAEEEGNHLKRELKKMTEAKDELAFDLTTQQEDLHRIQLALEEEERKSAELRQFLGGLMKQKEEIIKKELEKSEQVLEFETKIQEFRHENDRLNDEIRKMKKVEEELKQNIKKQARVLKQQESARVEESQKGNKLAEKLRDKEKDVSARDEVIARLEEKVKREREKSGRETKDLENQLDEVYMKLLNKQKESNERIIGLQSDFEKAKSECHKIKQELQSLQEDLFNEKNRKQEVRSSLEGVENELSEQYEKIQGLEFKIRGQEQELSMREQQNFKLQGKILSYESQLEMLENEKAERLQNLHSDWENKHEVMVEEYENRLELLEKEKTFLKSRIEEKQREFKKVIAEQKQQQNNVILLKKSYEDKIKNLEDDRLALFSQKNTDTQRLADENRINFENLKNKEAECRRLSNQLQLCRASLSKAEVKSREHEEKIKSINKTYVGEVQQMKRREQGYKKMKENVSTSVWKSEREVRRVLQTAVKQILGVVDSQSTSKVVEISKNLQQSVLSAIAIKIDEKDE